MTVETLEAVRKSVHVAAPVEQAWDVFVNRLGAWWPLATHSFGGEDAVAAVFEADRLVERTRDGSEHVWGDVLAWEPPTRLVLGWRIGDASGTEVEVSFAAEQGGTRVDLVHSGWTTETSRSSYDSGWDVVLAPYAEAVGR